jgi:hypothetical protein
MTMTATDPSALVGFFAFDRDGEELGEVEGVYLGTDEPEWAAILMMDSRFVIIPLVEAQLYEDSLDVPFTAAQVAGAPLQGQELLDDLTESQEAQLLAYYTGLQSAQADGTTAALTDTGAEIASTAKEQGQQVASTAKEHGQKVASTAKEQTARVTSTAKEQGQQVLRSTAGQASEVVGTAKEQAAEVAQQASAQARNLLEETRTRVEQETAAGASKLGDNLSRLGREAVALAEGRPQEAPTVQGYVRRAGETMLDVADRAYGVSDDVRTRGIGGLLTDVQSFARRRPGVFLLGTAAAGVVAARAVRNAKEESGGQEAQPALPRTTNGRSPAARAGTRGAR